MIAGSGPLVENADRRSKNPWSASTNDPLSGRPLLLSVMYRGLTDVQWSRSSSAPNSSPDERRAFCSWYAASFVSRFAAAASRFNNLPLLRLEEERLGRDREVRHDELRAVRLETGFWLRQEFWALPKTSVEARARLHAEHVLDASRCVDRRIATEVGTPEFTEGSLIHTNEARLHRCCERRERERA